MVKRERPSTPTSSSTSPESNTNLHSINQKPDLKIKAESKKAKGGQRGGTDSSPGKGGSKTPWSIEEDNALIEIMDQVIKTQLWPAIKASGNQQLVARGSYGAQYHAKLLLRQGKTKK
ncbi:uncharacterized protein I303_100299 [Kwoniella dejecticola CBS 10117]|uniref:Myb-like domain-containing protein n=1 Tax=Kwoniella dejecticola CBS 10117 TaxID=1296121 RepID=A0A1A6AEI0_9TREE|nr:uncharacterized protein I303_00299 [Kwoniella dejecticola CBS 10117]OBR88482.1 hypothetical protein I303_00299 [Kwoniella dejecticola CBS 10117]